MARYKKGDSPNDVWLNTLQHMIRYWAIVQNPFALPGKWKLNNPTSPLYYTWFRRNVTNVHLLSSPRLELMKEAIRTAKKVRTPTTCSSRKKTICKKKSPPDVVKLCTYIHKKGGVCCTKGAHANNCGVGFSGSNVARCYSHRFLSSNDLLHKSIYKESKIYEGYVRLGASKLPAELMPGRGVISNRHFIKNECITTYAGTKKSLVQVKALKNTKEYDYLILPTRTGINKINAKPYVLGLMDPVVGKGLGSFVNAPYNGSKYASNCSFKYDPIIKHTLIYAIKDVWPGDELYMSYTRGLRGSREVLAVNNSKKNTS